MSADVIRDRIQGPACLLFSCHLLVRSLCLGSVGAEWLACKFPSSLYNGLFFPHAVCSACCQLLVCCLASSSTLKMEVMYSSETSVDFNRITRLYSPEDLTLLAIESTDRYRDVRHTVVCRTFRRVAVHRLLIYGLWCTTTIPVMFSPSTLCLTARSSGDDTLGKVLFSLKFRWTIWNTLQWLFVSGIVSDFPKQLPGHFH
jgi:hypothetical protein